MTRITKGIIARILVAICILMQVVIMLPHHHHEGSSVACINILHCSDGHCAPDQSICGCAESHCGSDTHSHDSEDSCVFNRTDMIRLERERLAAPVIIDLQLFTAQTIYTGTIHTVDAAACMNTISQLDRKRLRTQIPLYTSYVIAAIPPRAPSFTV